MPIINLENPTFISVDGAGRANAGGTVGVYVAGTSFVTPATIYSDQARTVELTNPVTLDDAGTKEIWFDVIVDIREKTKADALIRDTLNIDPNANATISTSFNLAQNGSFEVDDDADGQPDNWTISPYSGSDIAITSTIVTDGTNALEFNTTGAGAGGGTAKSLKFPVTKGTVCSVSWSFFATNATTLNTFQIKWYDELDVLQSTSTLANMPASGSVPTSWTNYTEEVTADAAATQGEIVLTGISSGGLNLNSKAYFDGIKIINFPNMVTLDGTQILIAKTLTSPTITGTVAGGATYTAPTITSPDIDQILDSAGNEAVIFAEVASAVNELTVTNAASGNKPSINQTGTDDVGLDIEGVEIKNSVVTSTQEIISNVAASERTLFLKTSGSTRWRVAASAGTEPGADVDSNFLIVRHNDAGTAIDNPLTINRATGVCTISNLSPGSAGTAIAGQATGDLGTEAWLVKRTVNLAIVAGTDYAGSDLAYYGAYADLAGTGNYRGNTVGTALSGTWRARGSQSALAAHNSITLFTKVAN